MRDNRQRRSLMCWIPRTIAVVTVIALVFHGSLPTLAANGATIEGTVKILCDPARLSEVASVQIRPVSGGPATTIAVDSSTGAFLSPGLTEGEYELIVIGTDGNPMSPEPERFLLRGGVNTVVLSVQPPGCGEQDADPLQGEKKPGKKRSLKDWHLTLIYAGVVAAVVLAVSDDEDPATVVQP